MKQKYTVIVLKSITSAIILLLFSYVVTNIGFELSGESDLIKNLSFWYQLDDERQYALLDMCFNMGIKRLLGFKRMLNAMLIGDYRGAAKECLMSKYAKDVGLRAVRISRLIETGVWVK